MITTSSMSAIDNKHVIGVEPMCDGLQPSAQPLSDTCEERGRGWKTNKTIRGIRLQG